MTQYGAMNYGSAPIITLLAATPSLVKLATKSMGHFDTFAFFRNLEEIASFTPFLIFIMIPF